MRDVERYAAKIHRKEDRTMRITLRAADLQAAVKATKGIINRYSKMPILLCILIEEQNGRVTFRATDTETTVTHAANMAALGKQPLDKSGAIAVPAKELASAIKGLPKAAAVTLESDSEFILSIDTDTGASFKLQGLDPANFPSAPAFIEDGGAFLPQTTLKSMIQSILFAIPRRDPRKVLLGGLVELDGTSLKMVATDGRRLGFSEAQPDAVRGNTDTRAIIPSKALAEIVKSCKKKDEVEILFSKRDPQEDSPFEKNARLVSICLWPTTYIVRSTEGEYPNYKMVIPQTFAHKAIMNRQAALEITNRATAMADPRHNAVTLNLTASEIAFSSMTYDVGSFRDSIPAIFEDGNDDTAHEICFNSNFLAEVLKTATSKTVSLEFNTPSHPVVVRPIDPSGDSSTLFVIMPIKLEPVQQIGDEDEEPESSAIRETEVVCVA